MSKTRWLQVVLVISVSINLLIAGAVLGRMQERTPPPLGWAVQQLDEDTRSKLRPILREQITATVQQRRELRRLQRRVRFLMGETELDVPALRKTLADLRALQGDYQAAIHEKALRILAELGPEQRMRVAGRLLRAGPEPGRSPERDRRPPTQGLRPPQGE